MIEQLVQRLAEVRKRAEKAGNALANLQSIDTGKRPLWSFEDSLDGKEGDDFLATAARIGKRHIVAQSLNLERPQDILSKLLDRASWVRNIGAGVEAGAYGEEVLERAFTIFDASFKKPKQPLLYSPAEEVSKIEDFDDLKLDEFQGIQHRMLETTIEWNQRGERPTNGQIAEVTHEEAIRSRATTLEKASASIYASRSQINIKARGRQLGFTLEYGSGKEEDPVGFYIKRIEDDATRAAPAEGNGHKQGPGTGDEDNAAALMHNTLLDRRPKVLDSDRVRLRQWDIDRIEQTRGSLPNNLDAVDYRKFPHQIIDFIMYCGTVLSQVNGEISLEDRLRTFHHRKDSWSTLDVKNGFGLVHRYMETHHIPDLDALIEEANRYTEEEFLGKKS